MAVSELISPFASESTPLCPLPPLILHPISDDEIAGRLLEGSRAYLTMRGLLPDRGVPKAQLDRTLLQGRISEVRMLYYVGKDVVRWIGQCMEAVENRGNIPGRVRAQSFARLLIDDTPEPIQTKLRNWGVLDYRAIFTRGLALNILFAEAPSQTLFSDEFLHNYARFLQQVYNASLVESFAHLHAPDFPFDIHSSGEYSDMLAREWAN